MGHSIFSLDQSGFLINVKKSFRSQESSKKLSSTDLEGLGGRLQVAQEDIWARYKAGKYPFLSLVGEDPNQGDLFKIVQTMKEQFETVLVLGTGGSSLGGQSLVALKEGGVGLPYPLPHLYFLNNVDPFTFEQLLPTLDWKKTGILVISKSGETTETIVQILHLQRYMVHIGEGDSFSRNTWVITQFQESPLLRFARKYQLHLIPHDPGVGGRFSVFSVVGLLPLMLVGLDPYALREGGRLVLEAFNSKDGSCGVLEGAGLLYLYGKRHLTQTVMMPYVDRLGPFAFWFRQLWAESLGKNRLGLTPIRAMGTVDQHSQLQLYMDGPEDKTYTFLTYKSPQLVRAFEFFEEKRDEKLDPDLSYLHGKSLKDVLWAEQKATMDSLREVGAPVREFSFDEVTEKTLGGLYMHFMLETLVTAHLFGIDPLTQPAVQQSKILTRQYLCELSETSHGSQAAPTSSN